MLKKFASSLLAVALLAGCGAGSEKPEETAETETAETTAETAETETAETTETAGTADVADMAAKLVDALDLSDTVSEVQDRVMFGMLFEMDKDTVTNGKLYLGKDTADTVGVFEITDKDKFQSYIDAYVNTQKENAEMYNADEVFKITNAVVYFDDDNDLAAFIVCNDIEQAKTAAADIVKH